MIPRPWRAGLPTVTTVSFTDSPGRVFNPSLCVERPQLAPCLLYINKSCPAEDALFHLTEQRHFYSPTQQCCDITPHRKIPFLCVWKHLVSTWWHVILYVIFLSCGNAWYLKQNLKPQAKSVMCCGGAALNISAQRLSLSSTKISGVCQLYYLNTLFYILSESFFTR